MFGKAGRHRHQRQDNEGEREEQQQCGREAAVQPASEQEIAQRPRGNGQARAEQDCRGEGQQHRQDAKKQTPEKQEQDGALEELRGTGRGGRMRRAFCRWEFIRHCHWSPPDASASAVGRDTKLTSPWVSGFGISCSEGRGPRPGIVR